MSLRGVLPLCVFLIAVVAAIALSIGAGPRGTIQQEIEGQKSGQTGGGLQLTASVARERFRIGEPITLKVVLKNNGYEEYHLSSWGARKDYELDVRNEEGKLAPLTEDGERFKRSGGLTISSGRIILKPGEEHEDTILLTKTYDLTAPGSYAIIAKRQGPHQDGQDRKDVTIKSNRITITVE